MSVETETTEASGVNALLQMLLEDRRTSKRKGETREHGGSSR